MFCYLGFSKLVVLLVTLYRPAGHDEADGEQGENLMGDCMEGAASDEDGADGVDEVVHRVDVGGQIGPMRHGARRREEAAEQHETNHEEPHDKDRLLHGVGIVRNDEAERREEQRQQHSQHIDEPDGTAAGDAVESPCQQQAGGDDKEGDEPVGDELGKDECPLRDRGDVDLLDGACLLFADDVERRQEARHQHHHDGKESGNHIDLVVLVLVVEQERGHLRLDGGCFGQRMGGDDLRQVGRAHRSLGTIDGIGGDEDLRLPAHGEVAAIILRYHQHYVGLSSLNVGKRCLIGGLLSVEDEVVACLDVVDELLARHRAVVIDHIHHNVPHLHAHHPGHDAHDDDGEEKDEPGQEGVAPYLQELFLDKIFQCHISLNWHVTYFTTFP